MAQSKYLGRRSFTLAVSSSFRTTFSNDSCPWASFQLYRASGSSDASYRVWTTNFDADDIVGLTRLGDRLAQMTGAIYQPYWTAEVGVSGTAFTGSATDAASPFTMHLADIGTRHIMVEVSSSFGGPFVLLGHAKG